MCEWLGARPLVGGSSAVMPVGSLLYLTQPESRATGRPRSAACCPERERGQRGRWRIWWCHQRTCFGALRQLYLGLATIWGLSFHHGAASFTRKFASLGIFSLVIHKVSCAKIHLPFVSILTNTGGKFFIYYIMSRPFDYINRWTELPVFRKKVNM